MKETKIKEYNFLDATNRMPIMIDEICLKDMINKYYELTKDENYCLTGISFCGGFFLSCLTAMITSDFKDIGLTANLWKAIFIVCSVISGIALIVLGILFFMIRKKRISPQELIDEVKNVATPIVAISVEARKKSIFADVPSTTNFNFQQNDEVY